MCERASRNADRALPAAGNEGRARRRARRRSLSGFALRPLGAGLALVAADWCAVFACLAAMWWLRDGPLRQLMANLGAVESLSHLITRLYGLAPWTLAFAEARLYTRRTLFWDETRRVVYACTLAALFAIALSFAEKRSPTTSRLVIGGVWLTTIVVVPAVRAQAKRLLAAVGLWRKRVLILGAGSTGIQVVRRIRQNPELGYLPVAFVDDDPAQDRQAADRTAGPRPC